jgi:hypothetical protein
MALQSLVALVKMELKKLIRQPANLFLNLLFPAVLTMVFIFAFADPELGMSINSVVPGLIVYAVIFVIMTIAQSFSTERQEGLLKRLNTTPMTSGEFMGSQVIYANILFAGDRCFYVGFSIRIQTGWWYSRNIFSVACNCNIFTKLSWFRTYHSHNFQNP